MISVLVLLWIWVQLHHQGVTQQQPPAQPELTPEVCPPGTCVIIVRSETR